MEYSDKKQPRPGSRTAVRKGCLCPERQNDEGKGIPCPPEFGIYNWAWWITEGCPLHRVGIFRK